MIDDIYFSRLTTIRIELNHCAVAFTYNVWVAISNNFFPFLHHFSDTLPLVGFRFTDTTRNLIPRRGGGYRYGEITLQNDQGSSTSEAITRCTASLHSGRSKPCQALKKVTGCHNLWWSARLLALLSKWSEMRLEYSELCFLRLEVLLHGNSRPKRNGICNPFSKNPSAIAWSSQPGGTRTGVFHGRGSTRPSSIDDRLRRGTTDQRAETS
jgi:hypothetical protein